MSGVLNIIIEIVLFILIIGLVILAHEFGHFIIARVSGIHVVEFSVGMGPRLVSRKHHGTRYSLRLLPIGGSCMYEEEDFSKAGIWSRIATIFAGPLFNIILAFIIATLMTALSLTDVSLVRDVTDGGPAAAAGMEPGDRIVKMGHESVYMFRDVQMNMIVSRGNPIRITYERAGDRYETVVTPAYDEASGRYLLGIVGGEYEQAKGLAVFRNAYYELRYNLRAVYKSLGMIFTGRFSRKDVAGPVGIANIVGQTYTESKQYGAVSVLVNMLNIAVLISVNLGVLNLLPLPALDGGRLVFLVIELVRGKPVPPDKEGIVHFIGMVLFLILAVVILINDILNVAGI